MHAAMHAVIEKSHIPPGTRTPEQTNAGFDRREGRIAPGERGVIQHPDDQHRLAGSSCGDRRPDPHLRMAKKPTAPDTSRQSAALRKGPTIRPLIYRRTADPDSR